MKWKIIIIIASIYLSGCTARMGDLTVISSKNFDVAAEYELVERDVKGSDGTTMLLSLSFGGKDLEEAVEKALRKAQGDFMTNVVIYEKSYTVFGLFGYEGIVVRGDVWRRK